VTPEQAAAAVGTGRQDDYVLEPQKHADELEANAPELARLLRNSQVKVRAEQYQRLDEEAGKAQRLFKKEITRANAAVFATATVSALVMGVGLLTDLLNGATRVLLVILGVTGILAGGAASMFLYRVKQGHFLEEWMTARARAETARLGYFSAVVATSGGPPDAWLDLLRLEYFRRYQLDLELAFYRNRGSQHRESGERTLRLSSYSLAIATVTAALAGFLGAFAAQWAALGALAVVGSSLGSFSEAREAVNQDRRNSERYARTLDALENLQARLDEVRDGVAAGSSLVLQEFVAAVQEQISLEHRQWLEGAESTKSAIGRLEAALSDISGHRRSTNEPDGTY
jgi:hypothetical protein